MNYRVKNGYKISSLTLGTVQFGLAYGINNDKGMPSFEESSKIIDTALSAGIVSFDTARSYGESEKVLGRYFANESRERTIITKVLFEDVEKSEVKDTLFSQLEEAKVKLGVEKIPFIKLHREGMLEKYGDTLVRAMQDAKAEGLVGGVGVSFSDKTKILELTDGCGFDVIQIPANIFDNKEIVNGTVKHLADGGAEVMIRSVYLQGLFFKDTNTLEGKIKCAKAPLDKLHALANDAGVSMAELAITFIRDTEGISSLILGCDTPEQLLESVSLINEPKMDKSVRDEALKIASEIDPIVIRPWEWFK